MNLSPSLILDGGMISLFTAVTSMVLYEVFRGRGEISKQKYLLFGGVFLLLIGGTLYLFKSALNSDIEYFNAKGELLCKEQDAITIVSLQKGYSYKGGYFIKGDKFIDDILCQQFR